MNLSMTEPQTSSSRSGDEKYCQKGVARNTTLPVTKISLPNLSPSTKHRDFLPMIVMSTVFMGTFFVGHQMGIWFLPQTLPLSQAVASLGEKSLASVGTASKKITDNIKITKKPAPVSSVVPDRTLIHEPEPSLSQSWRELVASASVGGNKLSLFGGQLWDVVANKTAYAVDWLAYGVVNPPEQVVEAIKGAKVSASDKIGGSFGTAAGRVVESSIEIRQATLAMSSQIQTLDDFDRATTAYLSELVTSLGRNFLSASQQTRQGLSLVGTISHSLPADLMSGVGQLFWEPLAEKTINLSDKTLLASSLVQAGSRVMIKESSQTLTDIFQFTSEVKKTSLRLGADFSRNVEAGYEHVSVYSGQTSSQVAAVKFLSIAESSKEFFNMLMDRIGHFWSGLVNFISNLWQTAVNNWKIFFGLTPESRQEITQIVKPQIDDTTLVGLEEKIKNDLRNELRKEIADVVQRTSANNLSDKTNQGLVVVPSTGDPSGDEKIKADIQKMFSDQVTVSLDSNRKAGVVTPVFNPSENYIFLLTPIKK